MASIRFHAPQRPFRPRPLFESKFDIDLFFASHDSFPNQFFSRHPVYFFRIYLFIFCILKGFPVDNNNNNNNNNNNSLSICRAGISNFVANFFICSEIF